jgi:BirA family transcriptional regulator, biotin operon repressor / biotin---[acetyl-CoA-carboxylase] ligase
VPVTGAPAGAPAIWLDSVDSTNLEARRRADSGETGPLWIASHEQTAGRGRRGRAWTGLCGNLFCTGLFTLQHPPAEAANLSFAAALAVAETADHWIDPQIVSVKWPNDVLLHGIKTSGILLESWTAPGRGLQLAVGIGINVAAAPASATLERRATCLAAHLRAGSPVPGTADVLERLSSRFAHWFGVWEGEGFAPLQAAWMRRAAGLGRPAEVRLPDRTLHGVLRGISETGALLLEAPDGVTLEIAAGDVFFPS